MLAWSLDQAHVGALRLTPVMVLMLLLVMMGFDCVVGLLVLMR